MNRIINRAALLAATLFFCVSAQAQFGNAPAELELIKLNDDMYVISNVAVPGLVTVLVTDEGVVLVDDKFEIDYDGIMRLVRSVTDQPVKYVINTHYHGDHSGGNALLQERGAKVVASENARIKMVEESQPGLPDVTLDEHVRIYLGGVPVDAYYFGRSHTDGDVVVHLPEHSIIVMGDMFTHGDGLPQLVDYRGGGSMRAWPRTLDGALALDFETVIPGHGVVTDRARLERFRGETAKLGDTVRTMIRAGRTADEIESVLRSEFGFQDLHVQNSLAGLLVEMR